MLDFNYAPSEEQLQIFFKNFNPDLSLLTRDPLLRRVIRGPYKHRRWVTVECDEQPIFAFPLLESAVIDKDTPAGKIDEKKSDTFIAFGTYYFLVTDSDIPDSLYGEDLRRFIYEEDFEDLLHLIYKVLYRRHLKELSTR